MRVVAMFRVSTEKQATEGASLDAQQRRYRELALQQGWETVAEFRGQESASQAAADRRVLQQVLACIREHRPDAIYVHEQSRLTRGDDLDVMMLMRELKDRRVNIIVNGVVRDLRSIDERFMVGIQSLIDRTESERIKERMCRGRREKALRGKKATGGSPYGYMNPPPGDPMRGTLRVVEEEAVVVRKIFTRAAEGDSPRRIASELNTLGIAAPRGGRWGKSTVTRILRCPAYIGTSVAFAWRAEQRSKAFRFDAGAEGVVSVESAHEPIVDRALWERVQRSPRPATAGAPRLLTGLLMVNGIEFKGEPNRGTPCYVSRKRGVGAPWLPAEMVDSAVWDAFVSLVLAPEFVERLLRDSHDPVEQEIVQREIEFLEESLAKAAKRRDRLIDMRADGELSKDQFASKSSSLEAEMAAQRKELEAQRSKIVTFDRGHADRVTAMLRTLLAGRTALSQAQKRRVIRSVVRRVELKVVPSGAKQTRDPRGGFKGSAGSRWAIERIAFTFGLDANGRVGTEGAPTGEDPAGTPYAANGYATAAIA